MSNFKFIAENINIMSKTIGPAMRGGEKKPIQDMAVKLTENGADYLDINLGPARKGGPEMMRFVVQAVQEATDLPLYLDTMNVEAMEAGLQVAKRATGKPVINSIMARPERMAALFPLAQKYDAGLVALVYGPEGLPRDENERGGLAAELMGKWMELGIADGDVWLDPIVVPVCSQQLQVQGCTNFTMMFNDGFPGMMSTCGLSNVSNGAPDHLRAILNQTYITMLRKDGNMKAAILDGFDKKMFDFVRGKHPEVEQLVWGMMDGNAPDPASLSEDLRAYAKTTRVLLGQALYSDSWLEL